MNQDNRMLNEFVYLTSLDSVSFHEERIADYLKRELKSIGFEVIEDEAGAHYQGKANNIYACLKGNVSREPVLFSAHMDTVQPGLHKKAMIHEDGTITSDGTTVLGADDVCGIVSILEASRRIQEEALSHGDIEVLFTIAEEPYIKGSEVFDFSQIHSSIAYVLDLTGEIGEAAYKAPSLISFEAEFIGKEAHAGFAPEQGIHAIAMAAKAVSQISLGHVDQDSTVNIGTITGGAGINIVPKSCRIQGEIRSYRHERAIELLQEIKSVCEKNALCFGGECKWSFQIHLLAYEVSQNDQVVTYLEQAANRAGVEISLVPTFGGSDNHNLQRHGIHGVVMACGMHQVHSCQEYTKISDLCKSVRLVKELMIGGE